MWNKDLIQNLLKTNDFAVERGILAIHAFQTADEQSAGVTSHDNNIGFNGVDAPFLSSLAVQIMQNKYNKPNGNRLSPKQMVAARKAIMKYWKQLAQVANKEVVAV